MLSTDHESVYGSITELRAFSSIACASLSLTRGGEWTVRTYDVQPVPCAT